MGQLSQEARMSLSDEERARALVSGVKDLFPGADRQALQCLADLMRKDIAAVRAEAIEEAAQHVDLYRPLGGFCSAATIARDIRALAKPRTGGAHE